MMSWARSLVLTGAAVAVVAAAFAVTPVSAADNKAAFSDTDLNDDGQIDREEYHRRMIEVFYFTDDDKDGMLTIVEIGPLSRGAFQEADRDGDGKISDDEYINSRFLDYEAADKDGDGVLMMEEVEGWSQ